MLTKISKRTEVGGQGGFTLIELLVVIIIIGILAAIAIPMYLAQRTKGYNATAQSDLRNAAVAQESYFANPAHNAYTTDPAELTANGYHASATITLTPVAGDGTHYVMTAQDSRGGSVWCMSSSSSSPLEGAGACGT